MTFQSAPECAEAVIQGTYGGTPIANVLNFWYPGGYDQANIDDLAEAVDAAVGTNYLPVCVDDVEYVQTLVRGLENVIDLQAANGASSGPGGDNAGTPLPGNVTLCITLRTGFTGRSARGRFYAWPAGSDSLLSPDVFVTAYADALEAFLEEVKSQAIDVGWHLVILSRVSGGVPRGTATHLDVTSILARNTDSDSMRRRLKPGH